jgi:hypothetical protein
VSSKGDGAGEGEEVAQADGGEEVGPLCAGRRGEQQQAAEGEDGSDGGGPARGLGAGRAERGDRSEERNEDDDQAGDEGRLRGSGAGEAAGLELVAGGEEGADDCPGQNGSARKMAEMAVVDGREGDEGERHAQEVEEERSGVLEGVFDQDEGGSPDDNGGEQ